MKSPPPALEETPHDGTPVVTDVNSSNAENPQRTESDFNAPKIFALLAVSLIPFLAIPAAHVLSDPSTATGFFHYELPYYVANGRAAFERGNGLFYPNPYDSSADAPQIYAHWLPWLFGFATSVLGFDPGDVILLFTVAAAVLFAFATRHLINWRISDPKLQAAGFLLAMWGGGLFAIAGVAFAGFSNALRYDPGDGMWFLNWGRNALFPTEAIYHSLVAFCWVAELRERRFAANIFLLLLATTHPWSGLELLLTINLWRGLQWLKFRDGDSLQQLIFSATVLFIFLGYYKIWLPSFPSHAELQNVWELDWSVSWLTAGLAWLPLLIPALIHVASRVRESDFSNPDQFLVCAFTVAAGLALHDRIIKPVQPIHFTRGYVWMPLFLLAVPTFATWWQQLVRSQPTWNGRRAIAALCVAVFVFDNFAFSLIQTRKQLSGDGFHLTHHKRALLLELEQHAATSRSVVLTESQQLNYLLPAYANARPWLGHLFNTPRYQERDIVRKHVFGRDVVTPVAIPEDVEVVVFRRDRNSRLLEEDSAWDAVDLNNGEWTAWRRNDGDGRISARVPRRD